MDLVQIDTEAYLRSRNIPFSTEGENTREGWVNIRCVFCDDPLNHLGINLSTNRYSCWKCKSKGAFPKLVMILENLPYKAAIQVLENFIREIPYKASLQTARHDVGTLQLPHGIRTYDKIPGKLLEFCHQRGISLGNLIRNSIGWTGPYAEKPCKIVFPLTFKGQVVSYVLRDYSGLAEKKYINCEDHLSLIPPKSLLYGYDLAPENSTLVVVEGIIDKLKLGKRAVATLGIGWKKEQVLKLYLKNPKKIFVLFDSEPEAQKNARNLASQLWFCQSEVIELSHVNDPGELSEEEGSKLMQMLI